MTRKRKAQNAAMWDHANLARALKKLDPVESERMGYPELTEGERRALEKYAEQLDNADTLPTETKTGHAETDGST